ncbi:hypothetical protein PR003_g30794 [Phytophthora rubi]|uniref:Uncharacterized protein n=1 Tax=Phytophthora rubi TaxID=129364 RepID=A0A6A3GZR5_9STRA|nr:hypothetical protein PR002_g29550 [Phytophthora rubi]KAE9270511.1 hypothetical protein PR003_g30794 [Phytophthora rubi]
MKLRDGHDGNECLLFWVPAAAAEADTRAIIAYDS